MKINVTVEDEVRVVYSKLLHTPYTDWQEVSIHDAKIDGLAERLECAWFHIDPSEEEPTERFILLRKGLEIEIQNYIFPFPAPQDPLEKSRLFDSGVIATITYNGKVSTTTELSKDRKHIYDVGKDYREGEKIVGEIKRVIKEFYENARKNKSSPLKGLPIAS